MNKIIRIGTCAILSLIIITSSVIVSFAAVYVQDGNFKYQIFNDGTVAWSGYTSDTVDDVVIPRYYDNSTVISVANFGLENNNMIKSVDFMEAPDLNRIGMYAFHNCSSIESVLVPDSVSVVEVSAFRDCNALTDVVFYGNNNVVPVECFYNCSSLKNVRLSAYLKSIQNRAFAGCTSLRYLELLNTITYIAPNAFEGDNSLTLGVYYNSYAYHYAKDNNIPYVLLDGVKLGDVNVDGVVDILDATEIQKYAAESTDFTDEQFELGDINKDGYCDVIDALLVQKSVIGAYELPQNIIRY